MQLYHKSAAELSQMMEKKEISSKEVVESAINRVQAVDDKVNAFIELHAESALQQAKKIDEKRMHGDELSPLAGIPVGIKDNICVQGKGTTCGSKMLQGFVSPYHATVAQKLEDQGAILIGRTNMDEFAMGSSTETSYYGTTKNPWNLQCVPGGSSGGSAAAVAAGEVPLSLGSDTGGSIRQPAALCGVVGLKPTYGAVSRYGLIAFASSLDQIGPFARSVEDTALIFQAIQGYDSQDATSSRHTFPNFSEQFQGQMKKVKVGIPMEYFGEGVDSEVKAEVMKTAECLKSLGAELMEISLPSTQYAMPAYYILASAEASSNLARFDGVKYGFRSPNASNLNELYEMSRSEGFGDEVKRRIMLGTFVLSSGHHDAYYNKAKRLQRKIVAEFEEAFAQCDILLTPTSPCTAFPLGAYAEDPVTMYASDICTINVNIAGLPAISLPCGSGKNGMPIGIQLIGNKFREDMLLHVSYHLEKSVGGFNRIAEV